MEKIKEKVRKLLAQAEDRHGTLEGDVFYDKAFELIARYGIDRSDLDTDESSVVSRTIDIGGAYSGMQAALLIALAEALYCTGFSSGPRLTKISSVTLFGREKHLDRVDMLYAMLRLTMFSGAQRVTDPRSLVKARRSFMMGFINRISQRLADAENDVASSVPEQGLALIDDADLAYLAQVAYLSHHNLHVDQRKVRNGFHAAGYSAGVAAGSGADIGHERLATVRAIKSPPF